MNSHLRRLVIVALVVGAAGLGADNTPRPEVRIEVRIDSGALRGVRVDALPHGGEFLGIPFAAQPVGALRWKPPQNPPYWQGVRDAAEWGPACPQRPSPWLPEMLGVQRMTTDEACLWLNVWTPELHPHAKLPVFVWVHGGGNVEGSGEWPPLGPALAQQGIVVVSFNYRLGALGFFASPELDAESPHHVSGNYGHLDQLAALRWVQRNIAAFGGDPAKVTIGGESSGALDVCNLMASPLAAGLFRAAILESGVCVDSVYPQLRDAEQNGKLLAKDLRAASLKDLRAAPANRVLEATAQDDNLDLEPVVDGWVLPHQPAVVFEKGKQIAVPVLVGTNEDEISIFASPIVGGKSYRPKTVAAYRAWVRRRFGPLADKVLQEYPVQNDRDAALTFRTMDTDFDFGFGAWLMARQMQRVDQNAFLYRFTYVGAGPFAELGAFHSEELMFLSRRYWTSWVAQPRDADLSRAMVEYWTQFVKTANPNGAGLPAWAPVSANAKSCQELGRRIGPEAVPRMDRFGIFQTYLTNRLQKTELLGN